MKGTVIKRGESWSVVLDLGRDAAGRRQRKWHSGFRTKRDAEQARIRLLGDIDKGTYSAPNKISLSSFLVDEWLPAKKATLKPTTLASYDMHVRCHLIPRLGSLKLSEITPPKLNLFYAELLTDGRRNGKGGLSHTTVHLIHATVHKALSDAVRWGRIARNPADQADPPRPKSPEMTIWTPAQLRKFLSNVYEDRLYALWLLAATTGMRRGELLGLRWRDVDLDSTSIHVRQAITVARYEIVTGTPKTDTGARAIAIDSGTADALRSHATTQMKERELLGGEPVGPDSLVFTLPDGKPIHPEQLSRWFARQARSSGLPPIRLHDVRHSYVSALLAGGVPVKVVSQRVGHSSPMVTLSIYQHVLPSDDRNAASTGARFIFGDEVVAS